MASEHRRSDLNAVGTFGDVDGEVSISDRLIRLI